MFTLSVGTKQQSVNKKEQSPANIIEFSLTPTGERPFDQAYEEFKMRKIFGPLAFCVLALAFAGPAIADTSITDKQLATARAFFEYVFDFKLDDQTVQAVRSGLSTEMANDPDSAHNLLDEMSTIVNWEQSQSTFNKTMLRMYLEPSLVADLQKDRDQKTPSGASSAALMSAWDAHNPYIANGRPPLRQSVVDAFIALTEFLDKESSRPVPSAFADHAQFSAQVATLYKQASPPNKLAFNQVVPLWYEVQYAWAHASDAQKAKMRQAWKANSSGNSHSVTVTSNGYSVSSAQLQTMNPATAAQNLQNLANNESFLRGTIMFGNY